MEMYKCKKMQKRSELIQKYIWLTKKTEEIKKIYEKKNVKTAEQEPDIDINKEKKKNPKPKQTNQPARNKTKKTPQSFMLSWD